jgi:hypothetical protein
MLAILSALSMGALVYSKSDLATAAIAALCGYAVFVAYAWIRSSITARDPIHTLSLAAGQSPTGPIQIERFFAALLIPAGVAYVSFRVFS